MAELSSTLGRAVVIRKTTGNIINAVVLGEGSAAWEPPIDCEVIADNDGKYEIGGKIIDGVYTAPEPPRVLPDPKRELTQRMEQAAATGDTKAAFALLREILDQQ